MIPSLEVLELVGDEDDRGPAEVAADTPLEEMAAHVGVHGREGIVQKVEVSRSKKWKVKESFQTNKKKWERLSGIDALN